jgi:hypothetical protein
LNVDRRLILDLSLIGADACAGLALAVWLFATPGTMTVTAIGAIAGMLPDPLQFVQSVYRREPLNSLQRFHGWIHSGRKLAWRVGVSSQLAFVAAVAGMAVALLNH